MLSEGKQLKNIDEGIDSVERWTKLNTIATIVTGIATTIMAVLGLLR